MSNVRVIAEQVFAGTGAWILEATLELTDNTRVKRHSEIVSIGAYRQFFVDQIRSQSSVVFHSGNIFPDDYAAIRAVTFVRTDDRATVDARLTPADQPYRLNRFAFWVGCITVPSGLCCSSQEERSVLIRNHNALASVLSDRLSRNFALHSTITDNDG